MNAEREAIAYTRFLNSFPKVKTYLTTLTEQEANCLGISLDSYREHKLKEALANEAKYQGIDAHEFFLGFYADSPEEKRMMIEENKRAIAKAIGL